MDQTDRSRTLGLEWEAPAAGQAEDDARLLRACLRGDAEAARKVYAQFFALVYGIAKKHVGGQEAIDVCQRVFMSLFLGARVLKLQHAVSLRAWLAVTTNRAAARHRRWLSQNDRLVYPGHEHLEGAFFTGDPTAFQQIYERLKPLTKREQICWILRRVAEYTIEEIALELKTSTGTVKRILRDADAKIRLRDADEVAGIS
jgi:RNA polymerase sigma factor (sigma-70 family)